MNNLTVIPLKQALGIDEFKKSKSESRSWVGMKLLFSDILTKLSNSAKKTSDMTGTELLEAEVYSKVHDGIKHQLDYSSIRKILNMECRRGSGHRVG